MSPWCILRDWIVNLVRKIANVSPVLGANVLIHHDARRPVETVAAGFSWAAYPITFARFRVAMIVFVSAVNAVEDFPVVVSCSSSLRETNASDSAEVIEVFGFVFDVHDASFHRLVMT
jgi:hypothetical protein